MFFETLGTKLKMNIILKLKEKSLGVNELADSLNEERSKVSHALRTLLGCGFVRARKSGKSRIYSLNTNTIMPLLNLVDRHVRKYCRVCKKR